MSNVDEDGRGACVKCGRNQVLIDELCEMCDNGFTLKEINMFETWLAVGAPGETPWSNPG
jgi:hypothetical protein